MLRGIDVAGSYQPVSTIQGYLNSIDFCIVKATEGHRTAINEHASQVAFLRQHGKLVGHYHYAWPENGGKTEAEFFLSQSQPHNGDVLALDFEPYKSSAPASAYPQYIVDFAETVHAHTGAWPWLYANDGHLAVIQGHASAAQMNVIRQMPLWKAGNNGAYVTSPTQPSGNIHGWAVLTAWQWNASGIDRDVFYGDANTWRKLGVGGASASPAPTPSKPVPTPPPYQNYVVRNGDSLTSIAQRFYGHADWQRIATYNHITNPNVIYPGQTLRIPR